MSVDVPPSTGGGFRLPHVPVVEPGGITQVSPAQQSLVAVHLPLSGTHMLPQTKCPMPSGTQGVPLQQSAAEAQ